jgi:hypothetical protein
MATSGSSFDRLLFPWARVTRTRAKGEDEGWNGVSYTTTGAFLALSLSRSASSSSSFETYSCPIYSYTSLGSTHNTFPNPLLRATTHDGHFSAQDGASSPLGGWKPAWHLEDESAERAGRYVTSSSLPLPVLCSLPALLSEPPPTLPTASSASPPTSTSSSASAVASGLPSLAPALPTLSRQSTDPFSQRVDTSEEAQRLKREMGAFSG